MNYIIFISCFSCSILSILIFELLRIACSGKRVYKERGKHQGHDIYRCPVCRMMVGNSLFNKEYFEKTGEITYSLDITNYCSFCGAKLNWDILLDNDKN